MAKKRHQKNQSLAKNIALLFLSLGILAGTCILFSTVNERSDFSFDPFRSNWSNLVGKERKTKTADHEPKTTKTTASAFEYTYWDILLLQNNSALPAENNYSIQIASFISHDQALNYAKDLKEKTHLKFRVVNTGTWSAVRWGSFATKESAQRYCKELSSKLNRECIIIGM